MPIQTDIQLNFVDLYSQRSEIERVIIDQQMYLKLSLEQKFRVQTDEFKRLNPEIAFVVFTSIKSKANFNHPTYQNIGLNCNEE